MSISCLWLSRETKNGVLMVLVKVSVNVSWCGGDWEEGRLKSLVGLLVPVFSFLAALIKKAPATHFLTEG